MPALPLASLSMGKVHFLSEFFFGGAGGVGVGGANGMQKFPSQGSNPHHGSGNAESLMVRPPGNSHFFCFVSLLNDEVGLEQL